MYIVPNLGTHEQEVVNPLGSIHLVAIVKTTILSMYGMDSVLRPFVDDIKKLVRVSEVFHETRTRLVPTFHL